MIDIFISVIAFAYPTCNFFPLIMGGKLYVPCINSTFSVFLPMQKMEKRGNDCADLCARRAAVSGEGNLVIREEAKK